MTDLPSEPEARAALDDLPVPLVWRRPARVDLPALAALYRAAEEHDGSSERTSLAGLQDYWDSPRSVPQEDLLVGALADGDLGAVAWSGCNRSVTEARRVWLGGAVRPDLRGRGIGSAVLRWELAHARAWDEATRADGYGPLVARAVAPVERGEQGTFLERHGLRAVRWFFEMSRPLDGPVEVVVPDGIRLVDWDPTRSEEVRVVIDTAFRDHWGFDGISPQMWADTLAASDFRAGWTVLAVTEDGDEVVGAAMGAAYEQDWEPQGFTEGYTDQMGVLRSHRGRGVATALLQESMRRFAADGMQAAGLGVDVDNPSGALRLYESLGYRQTSRVVTYEWRPAGDHG